MHGFFSIMSDVASVVAGGPESERAEARRIRAERERNAAERAQAAALHPVAIVAVGSTEPPAERLIGLQSAVAKAVRLMAGLSQLPLSLPVDQLARLRLRWPQAWPR